jgi:hypothetical protein
MKLKISQTIRLKFSLNPESYRTIIEALAEKRSEFHTYKLKEGRSYRVMLKNMHYSINPVK